MLICEHTEPPPVCIKSADSLVLTQPTLCGSLLLPAAHILSAVDPATGKPLDDAQAKAEIAIFMAAGFESTSHAITWCLVMLVRHTAPFNGL